MPRQLFTSGIAVSSNKPEIRKRYNAQNVPYANKTEVFTNNDPCTFYLGQTFFISDGQGGVVEYWFESAVATETDLVLKDPTSVRMVDSIASLRALEDLKMGDYVRTYGYHAGSNLGGGLFKVTDEPVDIVHLNGSDPSAEDGEIIVPSMTVDKDTVFKMRFNLLTGPPSLTQYLMIIGPVGSDKFGLIAMDSGNTENYVLQAILEEPSNPSFEFTLRDNLGNLINPNFAVDYGKWYEVEIKVTDTSPSWSFTSSLQMGKLFAHSPNMEMQWFEINGNHFPLNEGAGSIVSSDTTPLVQGDIYGDFSWDKVPPVDDGALHITANNGALGLTKQLPNNMVTPFDYGAINNESVTDYINDSTSAIQAAIRSGYDVDIPPSRLYITESLKIETSVQIRMHGSFMPMNDSGEEVTISDEANTTTILYSDKNIDYIVIQSRNVTIYNGLLYTFGSVDHSKAGILFDINYPMWRTDIVGVGVFGNRSYLTEEGKVGTTAFKIDCENLETSGYLTEGHIDGRAFWCHKGAELTPLDPSSTAFVNNINFTVEGFGCQVFYDFAFGGLFNVKSIGQDANVLLPIDQPKPEYTAFQFHNCHDCIFDVFLADSHDTGAHNGNDYAISGENNTIMGRMLKQYNYGEIELYGVASLNRNNTVKNPAGLVISNHTGFIAQFDNAIAFAGNEGKVSYKGYKAVGPAFFDGTKTNPSSTYTNADVDPSTDVTIHNGEDLLTNSSTSDRVGHSIADVASRELHFAEIVVDDLENMQTFGDSPLKQLLLSISGANINAIECILHFEGSPTDVHERMIVPDNTEFLDGSLFNLFGYRYAPNKNDALRMIIIRLIGQEGSATDRVFVGDIGVETKEIRNKPNVNIGGDQIIYGQHTIAEQLGADEYRYTDKPTNIVSGVNLGYGGEVLQLKESANGAIGLYKLNSNDDVTAGGEGTNYVLSAGVESDPQCSVNTNTFDTTWPLTPENGTIDVIYRFVNVVTSNVRENATTYITRLYADSVEVGEITKTIRGEEKIESISFPVNDDYPDGTVFTFTVESDNGGVIGSTTVESILRLTKSYLVSRPGAEVNNITPGSTLAQVEQKLNDLLDSLRDAGFVE